MNFTYKQLEAFLFSAKLRSFSAAASKLHTTQSAVSKRVAELEEQVGEQLFHRVARGLEVSQFGRQLLPSAEEAQRLWLHIEDQFSADRPLHGSFRVGVTELVALTWLTPLIQRIREEHAGLEIEPVVDAGVKLFEKLQANQIDLAIMPGKHWGAGFTTVGVGQVEEIWVASPKLKVPRRGLKPQEFARFPVIDEAAGSSKAMYYKAWREEHDLRLGKVLFTNSTTLLRELTVRGFGISQLSREFVRADLDAGRLRIVRSTPLPPMVYSAVYREDDAGPALARIVELAVRCCDFSRQGGQRGGRTGGKRLAAARASRPAGAAQTGAMAVRRG